MDNQLTLQRFNSYLGWELKKNTALYFHKKNILVIPCYCKLDVLAHEFVHYFQVMYQNDDFDFTDGMSTEVREWEAVSIERWFKARYMKFHFTQMIVSYKTDISLNHWEVKIFMC